MALQNVTYIGGGNMSNEDWANDFFDVLDREKEEQQVEPPKKYNVIIMNDDFSTWPFVVEVLTTMFGQTVEQANATTKTIHTTGKAIVGTYTKDIAETKAQASNEYAQSEGFPLRAETKELE